MSVYGVLEIGKSALAAQKFALDVTGQNIANINTPGYSRKTVLLQSAPTSREGALSVGRGVTVETIKRAHDSFIEGQLRQETSISGQLDSKYTALKRMEQVFNELSSDSLGKSVQEFFNAWQDLSVNPQGQVERQAVLIQAQAMVDDFHRMNGSLADIRNGADKNIRAMSDSINGTLQQLAEVNDQIQQMEFQGDLPNDLRDRRDTLVRDLSQKVGINYLEQADGTVTISLLKGPALVDGKLAASLSVQSNPANNAYADVMLTLPGGGTPVNVSSIIGGPGNNHGELGANLQVRDTLVNGFMGDLDELAYTLATAVNGIHAAGYGLDGSTGLAMFSAPPVPTPPATFSPGYSKQIESVISRPQQLAAAGVDPTAPGGGRGDNTQALKLAVLKDTSIGTTAGNHTLTSFYNAIVGKVGALVQGAEHASTQSTGIIQQLETMRESAVGVSLDEELTNMLKYQKAYEAAAKLISTGAEMLDTVLGMVR